LCWRSGTMGAKRPSAGRQSVEKRPRKNGPSVTGQSKATAKGGRASSSLVAATRAKAKATAGPTRSSETSRKVAKAKSKICPSSHGPSSAVSKAPAKAGRRSSAEAASIGEAEAQAGSASSAAAPKVSARATAKADRAGGRPSQAQHAPRNGSISVAAYRARLLEQQKKLYKDPPAPPPDAVRVLPGRCPLPERSADGDLIFADHPEFRPNLTPEEVLRLGSFGGTYFRSIQSAVCNRHIKWTEALSDVPQEWIDGVPKASLVSDVYQISVNRYRAKCGGSLDMWESCGWISELDPYGWFQWYCRFYLGRRTTDDGRQIDRGLKCMGPTGRWRLRLTNMIIKSKTTADDCAIGPVVRQLLQHWGYQLTQKHVDEHRAKTQQQVS